RRPGRPEAVHQVMRGLLGIFFLLVLAWALGERRRGDRERRIPWRTVIVGLGLQIALAVLLLRFPPASHVLLLLNRAALALQEATDRGTAFVLSRRRRVAVRRDIARRQLYSCLQGAALRADDQCAVGT